MSQKSSSINLRTPQLKLNPTYPQDICLIFSTQARVRGEPNGRNPHAVRQREMLRNRAALILKKQNYA